MPAILDRCNAFERAICRMVFQDKYSSSVKTYHVIDHLASRGEELGLMSSSGYLAAIEALKRFSSYHAKLIRGFAGERRAFYAVKHAMSDAERLVNLELDYEGEHNEFDQILITRQGLRVIEVKNYSSSATVGTDGILRLDNGSGRAWNLGERMASKCYAMRQIASGAIGRDIADERIVPLLVNANERSSVKSEFEGIAIEGTGSIGRRIGKLFEEDAILNTEEMAAIKAALEDAHHPIEIASEIDLEYVSASLHEALSLITQSAAIAEENDAPADMDFPTSDVPTERRERRWPLSIASGTACFSLALSAATRLDQRTYGGKKMNGMTEYAAVRSAAIDAENNKAPNCQGMIESVIDATRGITAPQAGLLGCALVSAAGLLAYGIHALCGLAKEGHPVEFSAGPARFAATQATLGETCLPQ